MKLTRSFDVNFPEFSDVHITFAEKWRTPKGTLLKLPPTAAATIYNQLIISSFINVNILKFGIFSFCFRRSARRRRRGEHEAGGREGVGVDYV